MIGQLFQFPFMVHALEAGTVVSVMAGVVGWFMVLRRESFAGHTLSLMAFPGATGLSAVEYLVAVELDDRDREARIDLLVSQIASGRGLKVRFTAASQAGTPVGASSRQKADLRVPRSRPKTGRS